MKLPPFIKRYFWDADVNIISSKNAPYVIERILEYGDVRAAQWLFAHVDKKDIKDTLMKRRGFSPRVINYWRIILGIDKRKITCLKKSYIQMRKSHWIY